MRILVVGAGGREHAFLLALSHDTSVTELHVAPGNPGMAGIATVHPVAVDDLDGQVALAREVADLVVIGPEIPLVLGLADKLRQAGIAVFGPSASAAQLEGSKEFAKDIMAAAGVRTARASVVQPGGDPEEIIDDFGPTWVVKDDGLAAGKGVVVTPDRAAALEHARAVLASGNPVLFEEFLPGPEVSLFALVDGETVVPLIPAQDHKRVGDGDSGPNTGGMGAYAPLPWLDELDPDAVARIVREVCEPVATEMARRGNPYSGLMYAGLAWGPDGPAVIEFNARFGDPETQAVLALLESPLGQTLAAVANGTLAELPPLKWKQGAAITVVLAAAGYPGTVNQGDPITGIPEYHEGADAYVLHAGTGAHPDGTFVSAGGRVLNVVGVGADLHEARAKAYELLEQIELEGSHYRTDIGAQGLK
ncbi:phosphoribosylamine--glycine ligase [Corynebacterium renale]|uniref:phosphoribosylamine--glycine ligase n=1 Tax=Corynebacterium renale TaxID=1724 RepID=UPI000E035165|nr:phosphoribosylamine--glycine ligase [Corynebacterium renale]STC99076.1 phosphoribosylamine--glycine ligase [Corynebacterium renale]